MQGLVPTEERKQLTTVCLALKLAVIQCSHYQLAVMSHVLRLQSWPPNRLDAIADQYTTWMRASKEAADMLIGESEQQ